MTTPPAETPRGDATRDDVTRRHDEAVRLGDDGYLDPDTGLFVFTQASHLARGTCCDGGCRHCPYG